MSWETLQPQKHAEIPTDLHLHGKKLEGILTDFYKQTEDVKREISYVVDILSKWGVLFKERFVTLQWGKIMTRDIEDTDEVYFQEKAWKPDESGTNYRPLENGAVVFAFLKRHNLLTEYRFLNMSSQLPIVFYRPTRVINKFEHVLNGGVGLWYVLETAVRIFDEKIEKALDIRPWLRKRRAKRIKDRKERESQPVKVTWLGQVLDVYEQLTWDLFDEVNLIMQHLDNGGYIKVFKKWSMVLLNQNGREISLISTDAIYFFRRLNLYNSQHTSEYSILRQNSLQRKLYSFIIGRDESILATLKKVAEKLSRRRKKRRTEEVSV